MASKETAENKAKPIKMRETPVVTDNEKLKALSCPFTWGLENVIENRHRLLEAGENRFEMVVDIQDNFPEFVLMYHVVLAYENFMSNDIPGAMKSLNDAEMSLADIKKTGALEEVENTLNHILVATKCYLLENTGHSTKVDELLQGITQVEDMDEAELAVLSGCQCLTWSLYYATDNLMAIKHAEEAIKHEPDNGKWYFLLGKNCRRLRRRHNCIGDAPNLKETSAFEKAFQLSENVLFGVSLAQMYRESKNPNLAKKVYLKVYQLKPTCCKVRLQLALGFIRTREREAAKDCLDYVTKIMPESPILTHYKAIYEDICNRDYAAALPYYTRATENKNFVAEWQYVECKKKIHPDWNPLPYLLSLLEKYDRDTDHVIQGIHIQIGAHYLFEERDIAAACISLTKAIEISPQAKLLTQHIILIGHYKVNLYHELAKGIQSTLDNATTIRDDEKTSLLKDTLALCRKHCEDCMNDLSSGIGIQSSRSRSTYGNYGRGPWPRAGISLGLDRPSSGTRGFGRSHPQRGGSDTQSRDKGPSGVFQPREHMSWRSSEQTTRVPRGQPRNMSGYDRYSSSADPTRGRGSRPAPASNPREKDNEEGAAAACILEKTLKKLNI